MISSIYTIQISCNYALIVIPGVVITLLELNFLAPPEHESKMIDLFDTKQMSACYLLHNKINDTYPARSREKSEI